MSAIASETLLEWGGAARPAKGETVCGDRACVRRVGGRTLFAAVDGLGHGPDAAHAAAAAVDAVESAPVADAAEALERAHASLKGTRGAAMSAATYDPAARTLTWVGVGNVEGRLVRMGAAPHASLMTLPGLVGYVLPALRPATLEVGRGDLLLLATDGILASFADRLEPHGSCRAIAQRTLAACGRERDDALILVARFLREPR